MINGFHQAINNGQIFGMVMVDFRNAFDKVDHIITLLLNILNHYKIIGKVLQSQICFISFENKTKT